MILKGDESLYSVVVIDDNRIAVEAIVRSTDWDLCGCQVAGSAYDGVAGLRLIEEVQPDIVVIDIQMPGFNGLEVIGKMREQKKNIQFIIISGYSQFEYARQALRYGVKDYLLKPVMKEEMEAALKHVADELNTLKRKNKQEEDLNDPLSGELKRIRKGMDGYSLVVSGALKRIEHDMDKNISLGDMAGEFLISPGHFSKCFKRETGVGFASYVTMVKMEKARALLKDPQNRVGEVARMLGYSDYAYFFQVFKKQFGYAPREIKTGDKKEGKGGD